MRHVRQNIQLKKNQIPIGNYIIMLLAAIIFAIQFLGDPKAIYLTGLVLRKPSLSAMLGYFWLHAGPIHIASNLLLLAIFGKNVCTKIGHANYILIYIILGFAAAAAHLQLDARPVIGASGAIFGVLGLTVVLSWKKLSPIGPWLIFIWIVVSIGAAIAANGPEAHIAHIAGFMAGMFLAVVLIIFNQTDNTDTGNSLMKIIKPTA